MSKFRLIVISVVCAGIPGCFDAGPAGLLIPRPSLSPGTYTGTVRGSITSGGPTVADRVTEPTAVTRVQVIGPSGLPSVGGIEVYVGGVHFLESGRISSFTTVTGIDQNSNGVVMWTEIEMQYYDESNRLLAILTGTGWESYQYAGPNAINFSMVISALGTMEGDYLYFGNDTTGTLTK